MACLGVARYRLSLPEADQDRDDLRRNGSQREPGARRQRERALGQGGAHGVAQGRLAGIVERGVEGAGGGTGGAGERLPVVVEVGVVDARLERAAGDALQAGEVEGDSFGTFL